ncbi:MAG TPA: FUSC family protein [Clostridiales bacterium]|nr:FUSC family protein [Clostridiales bacterium]
MIENIRKKSIDYIKLFKKNIPIILVAIALFWGTKLVFGTNVGAVSVLFLFTIKDLYKKPFAFFNYIKYIVVLLLTVTLGTLAVMNFFCAVGINLVYMFVLVYFFRDDFFTNRYYLWGLELILMQMNSGSFAILGERLFSVAMCGLLCGVFLFLTSKFMNLPEPNSAVDQGCKLICKQLNMLSGDDFDRKSTLDMFTLATDFCKGQYNTMAAQGYLLTNKDKQDVRAMITMEEFSKLIYDTAANFPQLDEHDRVYFNNLQEIFIISKNRKRLAIELDYFCENNKLKNAVVNNLWEKYIKQLSAALKTNEKVVIVGDALNVLKLKVKDLIKGFNFASVRFRKSLQTAIIFTIAAAAAYVVPIDYSYYLPLMAFTLSTIYPRFSFKMCLPQVGLVLIGSLLYILTIELLPLDYRLIVAVIISFCVLAVTNNTLVQMIFAAEAVVISVFPIISVETSVLLRLMFMCGGCLLGFLLVRWIVATKKYDIYRFTGNDIVTFDTMVLDKMNNMDLSNDKDSYLYEIILIQHLMIDKINYTPDDKNELDTHRYSKLQSYNCNFLRELTYSLVAISFTEISKNWLQHCEEQLPKLRDKLAGIK